MSAYIIYHAINDTKIAPKEDIHSDDLSAVFELLPLLKHEEDSIYVYINALKMRLQIWYFNEETCSYLFEIHNGYRATNFFREFTYEELLTSLEDKLFDYIDFPEKYGFSSENF